MPRKKRFLTSEVLEQMAEVRLVYLEKKDLKENTLRLYLEIASYYMPFESLTKEFILNYHQKLANSTRNTHIAVLKFLASEGFFPEEPIKNLKAKRVPFSRVKSKKELISREELHLIVKQMKSLQMQTFTYLLYESGGRIRELINAQITDIIFDDKGALVFVDGKTGPRDIRILEFLSFLNRWVIYRGNKPGQLWLDLGKELTYSTFVTRLKRAAKRAGIKKNIYPHLFRHSRATELVGLDPKVLEKIFGWRPGSNMPSVYSHLDSKDVDNALYSFYGLTTNEEKIRLSNCPRCHTPISQDDERCSNCNLLLKKDYSDTSEDNIKRMMLEDPEFIQFIRKKIEEYMEEEK